jgi:hypothetical protein
MVSTSALLLLLAALQLLVVGMMADGVLRRLGQQRGLLVPSRAIRIIEEARPGADAPRGPSRP